MTTSKQDLIERLRKSYRSLDGVVVVSPKLLAEAADALEAAERKLDDIRCIPSWGSGGVGGFDVDGDEYQIIQDILRGKNLTNA